MDRVQAQDDAPIFSWGGKVEVRPSSLTVTEGGRVTYEIRLTQQPASSGWWVRIQADGSARGGGIYGGISWVPSVGWEFNPESGKQASDPTLWREVSIYAPQDDDSENHSVTITHEVLDEESNCPPSLHGVAKVTVGVTDDDVPGIKFSTAQLTVPEGDSRSYGVKLNTQPTASTVTVSVSKVPSGADLTVDKPTLTFTQDDWDDYQMVEVTADEDDDAGDDEVVLRHRSSGGDYNGVQGELDVTITDDDEPGATVSKQSLNVPEGGSETYTVELDYRPAATVTVDLTLNPANPDLTVSPSRLTFTRSSWSAKTVRVSAREDNDALTDPASAIEHDFSGGEYEDVTVPDVTVNIDENDDPGITLSTNTLEIREGSSRTYTVRLDSQPAANVTVDIQGGDDVDLDKTSLEFTPQTWNSRQTVRVEAEHDPDTGTDPPVTVTHTASGSSEYVGRTAELTVTIVEDDVPSVTVSDRSLTVREGGSNSYSVVLDKQPSTNVTVTVTVPSNADISVRPPSLSLTFTTQNWDMPKDFTVTADDDEIDNADRSVTLTHAASGGEYTGVSVSSVVVRVEDDDDPGIAVSPPRLTVPEGGSNTYTVELDTQPTAESVTVSVTVPSGSDLTVDKPGLTFTRNNWSDPQTVTVEADHDDDIADDEVVLRHRGQSSGSDYNGRQGDSLEVTVDDDDVADATVSTDTLSVPEGGSNTYTVVLDFQPTATVTVDLTADPANPDLRINPSRFTFTRSNWSNARTIRVSASEDQDSSTDPAVAIEHEFSNGGYDSVTVPNVTVTIVENDTPGVTVSPTALQIPEDETRSYTLKLNNPPSANVTVAVNISSGSGNVTRDPPSVAFTPNDWSNPKRVEVTAVKDADSTVDTATLSHSVSGASEYSGISVDDVSVTVVETDRPSGNQRATGRPTISGTTVVGQTLTAHTTNIQDPDGLDNPMFHYQWIRVDGTDETNILRANSSTYRLVGADAGKRLKVWVSFTDNANFTETATSLETDIVRRPAPPPPPPPPGARSRTVTFGAGNYSVQEGEAVDVAVFLSLAPDSPVTIPLTAKNEGGATNDDYSGVPQDVVFDAGESTATFTFRAANDNVAEGTETVVLGFGTLPAGVNRGTHVTAEVSILEDDRGVRITPRALEVIEGGSEIYAVVLESEPAGTVTVTVGGAEGDLTVSPDVLSFTTSDWSTRQTVTVSAAEDEDSTVDAPVTLTHTVAGGGYGGVTAPNVEVRIRENDIPGVTVTPTELEVTEGSRETYTVVLDTEPAASVTVAVGGVTGDVMVSPATLTFAQADWSTAQTMTVMAAEDEDALDDPAVTLTHTVSGGNYSEVRAPNVVVTILDNDVPALSIEDAEASEGDGEISFAVTLDGPGSRTVRVDWATADKTATAGQDYTARKAELVFDPGETRQEVKVPLLDDTVVEPDETFTVKLSSPGGATLERSEATGTIVDNDLPLVSISAAAPSVDEGEDVRFDLTRSGNLRNALSVTVRVNTTGSFLAETPPAMVSFGSGESAAVLRIATVDDTRDEADGTVEAVLVEADDYVIGDPGKAVVAVTDNDRPPAIGIESARALEIAGEIVFPITLAAASDLVVTVEWSTSDGTARAEEDYRGAGGVVTFPPGRTLENIRVILLDDVLLEEEETFTVTLGRAVNGTLGQVTATGVIEDDEGIVFRAWLTRFGRTVATQVVEAVSERLSRSAYHPPQITVGGRQLRLAFENEAGNRRHDSDLLFGSQPLMAGGGLGAAGSLGRAGESLGLYGGTLEGTRFVSRRLGGRNLLSTSSFHLTSEGGDRTGNGQGAKWAAWGRGVTTQFGGRNTDLSLDGGVLTGLVGLDYERGPVMAGLAVSRSEGDGDAFAGRGQRLRSLDSDLSASLTSVYPYLRVDLEERWFTWGLFGYGRGEMGANSAVGSARHDIGMTMGAVGARGSLFRREDKNGLEVALKTDTFWVGMDLDSVIGPRITDADANRTRLLLEASCDCRYAWGGGLVGGAVDFGVRRDGGLAETGLGVEVGGVLNYLKPDQGLTASVTARRLMAHQDDGYREWGIGGMIEYDPGAAGRGLSVRMVSSWGTAPSGTNRFWSQSAAGLNRNGYAGMDAPLTAEVDYRMRAFGGRLQMAPYADMSLVSGASGAQSYLLGWRLQFGPNIRLQVEVDLGDDSYSPLYRPGLMGPGSLPGSPGLTPGMAVGAW